MHLIGRHFRCKSVLFLLTELLVYLYVQYSCRKYKMRPNDKICKPFCNQSLVP